MPNFWFKFEWGDWRDDRQLRRCSKETRGFWVDCIAEMESQQTYFLEGTPEEICRIVIATSGEFDRSIAELSRTGAATIQKNQGVVKIISRRLLKKVNLSDYNRLKQQEHREKEAAKALSSECQDVPSKDIDLKTLRALDSPIGEVSDVAAAVPKEKPVLLSLNFTPTAEMMDWAMGECPGLDIKRETEEFVGFWCDIAIKNNKRTPRGWNQTWKNRMRDQHGKIREAPRARTPSNPGKHIESPSPEYKCPRCFDTGQALVEDAATQFGWSKQDCPDCSEVAISA